MISVEIILIHEDLAFRLRIVGRMAARPDLVRDLRVVIIPCGRHEYGDLERIDFG